jgi:general secretion pathway protein K
MRQRGSVLIIALVGVAVLVMAAAAAAAAFRVEARSHRSRVGKDKAERMAESGLALALASFEEFDENVLSDLDDWAELGQLGDEVFYLGEDSVRLEIVDAGAFINLNTATQDHLENLPLTDEQIESLLDWREEDFQPRQLGAKDEYYRQLTEPYNAALRPLRSVSELLMIRGFDAETVYDQPEEMTSVVLVQGSEEDQPALYQIVTIESKSSNLTADGEQKTNINQARTSQLTGAGITQSIADAIVQRRNSQGTFTTLGEVFGVTGMTVEAAGPILDSFTVSGDQQLEGMINLNTAGEAVLNSIPGMTQDVTQAILGRQGTIETLGELAQIPGVSLDVLQEIGGMFTVGSQAFIVRLMGESRGSRVYLEALVSIEEGQAKLTRILKPQFSDMDVRWGWPEEPSIESELMDGIQ